MDYSRYAEVQQRPPGDLAQSHPYNAAAAAPHQHHNNPLQPQQQPPQLPTSSSSSAAQHQDYYPSYPPNPAATPASSQQYEAPDAAAPRPPGVEPYVPNPYYSHAGYAVPPSYVYSTAGPSSYYHGVAGDSQGFAVMEAIRQYGVDPVAQDGLGRPPKSMVPTHMNPTYLANRAARPFYNGAMKKSKKKPAKVVQSAFCEVCKIECNSQDVLKIHKQGKKHKKNLEKLKESIAPKPNIVPTATTVKKTDDTPQVEKDKTASERTKKRSASATEEDLETKRKRVLEGGAAEQAVRVCTLCNVVCNSQLVFAYHIAGQKHASMVKKQQESRSS